MFYTRATLHRRAYQHKTTKIVEHMWVQYSYDEWCSMSWEFNCRLSAPHGEQRADAPIQEFSREGMKRTNY